MKGKNPITVVFALLILIGVVFLGLTLLNLVTDTRWLVTFIIFLCGVAVLPLFREKERLLLSAMAFTIPFNTGFLYQPTVSSDIIIIFDVFLYTLYILWFIRTQGFQKVSFYKFRGTYIALIFIVWSALAVILSVSPLSSALGVIQEFKAFLVYFYIINNITDKKKLMTVIEFLVYGLMIQAVIGILQGVLGRTLGLGFLGEPQVSLWWKGARARGTFGFPNMYGSYIGLLISMAISLFIYCHGWRKLLYLSATVLSLMAVGFSLSRQSWLGIASSLLVMFLLFARAKHMSPKVFRAAMVILVAAIAVGSIYWDMIMWRTEQSTDYRMRMITIAIQIIRANPVFGVGLYNYQYHAYQFFSFWQPVHNCYLRLACESGVIGMFLFLSFYFLAMRESYRALKFKDKLLNAVGIGIFCGHTAFAVIILFGPQYQHYRHKFLFWLLAGLAVSLKRVRLTGIEQEKRLQEKRRIKALGDPKTRRSHIPGPPAEAPDGGSGRS